MTGALTRHGDLPAGLALALALHLAGMGLLGMMRDVTPPSLVPPRATRIAVCLKTAPPPRAPVMPAPSAPQPDIAVPPRPSPPPAATVRSPAMPPPPAAPERVVPNSSAVPVPRQPRPATRLAAMPDTPQARPDLVPEATLPPCADLLPTALADTEALDGDFDAAPRPRHTIRPVYPLESRQRGESGSVVAVVHVTAAGRVARVDIDRSSGHAALDRAARASLLAARFDPARRGASVVPARVRLTIVFMLKGVGR